MTDRTPTGTPGEGAAPRDEAFDRLQAADPAAGATTDQDHLAATVRARVGAVSDAGPADAGDAGHGEELAEVRPLGAARSRRPARWLQIAAAVAGVAIIGGGGYALGAAGDGTTTTAGSDAAAAPAIALEGAGDQELAGGVPGMQSKVATDMAGGWWYGGRTVFTQQGLSDQAGRGRAWGFDPSSVVTADTAARAAAALGVAGDPREELGGWAVGSSDGTGASLSVSADGLGSLSFYDPTLDPWAQCYASAADTPSTSEGSGASDGSAVEPAPVECTPSGDPAPTGDAAIAAARDVLTGLGLDPDAWEYEVQTDTGMSQSTYLTLWQVVDGQRTGVSAGVTLVAQGPQSVNVPLAPLVDLGEYDVVSAVEAVQRLSDPRFGSTSGGVMPLMASSREAASSMMLPEQDPTVPPTPTAGSPLVWPVQQVTLVSSRLGVALTTMPDGSTVLVPAYELTDADGTTWSVVAVVEDQLDFSPVG